MAEYILREKLEQKIQIWEKLLKEFPNNEELRIKIITVKEILEENIKD